MDKESLISFEEEIKELFLNKKIKSPVHLSRGNEEWLIKIFRHIKSEDWVFSTHRSHYHALLKGVSPEWLRNEILEDRSIHIFNKEHNFFSSAIVGGSLPIALGTALALKMRKLKQWVWVFTGDMAAEMGVFCECVKYARGHNLPISFVVEDNALSVNSPTQTLWGECKSKANIIRYKYRREVPHVGVGQWVTF